MQISLSPNADQLIERLLAQGYSDPASIVELALERMEQTTDTDSPEMLDWMRREVAIGAEQAERGDFSTLTLAEIKAQVLADHQQARA
jgi:antitoxin ParD1/3/4